MRGPHAFALEFKQGPCSPVMRVYSQPDQNAASEETPINLVALVNFCSGSKLWHRPCPLPSPLMLTTPYH